MILNIQDRFKSGISKGFVYGMSLCVPQRVKTLKFAFNPLENPCLPPFLPSSPLPHLPSFPNLIPPSFFPSLYTTLSFPNRTMG